MEAIQQMTVFAGGMLMLGLNILMFGTLFLLIRVIQRMNNFEKVNKYNHKVLKQSIFFQILFEVIHGPNLTFAKLKTRV